MNDKGPVIFFDGFCNLCNGAVQFTIARDHQNVFRFSSLQGDYAKQLLTAFKIDPSKANSLVLIEDGKAYERSTAALRIAKKLGGLWPLLYGLIIIPTFLRDWVYNYVAKNRYNWFGKRKNCWVPTQELKDKFL